jgi:hypothetical protein
LRGTGLGQSGRAQRFSCRDEMSVSLVMAGSPLVVRVWSGWCCGGGVGVGRTVRAWRCGGRC